LHVSQNGVLVAGTLTVRDNGQTIQFVPSAAWQKSALIQVFLDSTALDTDGNTVNAYQGSFRTVVDTTTLAPSVLSVSPVNNASITVPLNPVLEWQFNEPLNPNTVNTNTVLLQNASTGVFAAGTVTLDSSGTFIRFVPNVPLAAATTYNMETSGIIGTNGLAAGFTASSFKTGSASDATAPVATLVSPPDTSTNVPVNTIVHVRFNEPIDPLTVNAGTIQLATGTTTSVANSPSFSNNNQDVIITPQDPLPDNTAMTIMVQGVEDLAGNQVVTKTTQFTTGAGPLAVQPQVINGNPFSGATNVPLNTLITLQSNVPVDPGSVNTGTFSVSDNTTGAVAGTTSVSADGLTISFLPSVPLGVERSVSVSFSNRGITDLAGNLLTCSSLFCNFSFTTSPIADRVSPAVVGVSPPNQLTQVPINAQVVVQFNEPISKVSVGQVALSGPSGLVNTAVSMSNGQTVLILTPVLPLAASTQYTVTISSVQDLSGNTLPTPVTTSFTTAPGADLNRTSVVTFSPVNGAAGVPVNSVVEVQFSERINPLTVNASDFTVTPTSGLQIPGTIVVSADGQSATFTPSAALQAGTTYTATVSSSITDLTGQALIGNSTTFTTGVGSQGAGPSVVAVSPANNSTGVQANAKVMVQLNEPVEPLSVGSNAIVVSAGGTPVTGTISLSTDRTVLTFTPSSLLAVSTAYTVTVSGFEDVAGNAVALFSSSFTTGTSGVADTTPLTVSSFSPANGLTGVPVNTTIVLTF